MPQFMDQLSWAAVTADSHDRVRILSDPYNYPLRQRGGLPDATRDLDLTDIVHLHYRLFFHLADPLSAVSPPFAEDTPPGPFHLFRVDVSEAVLIRMGDPADHLVIETWHEGTGLRRRRRE